MVKLLEQLEELEDRARALQRIRRAQQRTEVERDW
jgi:2-iminoacetate synthase ThiH